MSSRNTTKEAVKISAIVPAFNEEKTIGNVLSVLTRMPEIDEVIVVNDGSTDRTEQVAKSYNIILVSLPENRGKGGAISAGLSHSHGEVVLLLDADLVGLRPEHIRRLLKPVISGRAAMSIGLFKKGRKIIDLAQKAHPYLTGQRAVRRDILEKINNIDITRFGFEIALTKQAKSQRLPITKVNLPYLTHLTKEEKMGLLKGLTARLRMYWEIVHCYVKNE